MCIAIYKPKDKVIPLEILEECWRVNDDGAGFMFSENKELHVRKGFMNFDSFYKAFKPHEEKNAVLHFRITTHGKTNEANTHPFVVGKDLAFVHNGIISAVDTKTEPDFSDTYHFNKKILHKLYASDNRFVKKQHFKDLITNYIGYSKLIFLDNKGRVTIFNEDKGTWDDGIWYSNNSYKPYPTKASSTYSSSIRPATRWNPMKVGDDVYVKYTENDPPRYGKIAWFGNGMEMGIKLVDEQNVLVFPSTNVFRVTDTNKELFTDNPFEVGDWVIENNTQKVGEVFSIHGTVCNVNFSTNYVNEYRFVNHSNLELFYRETAGEFEE